MEWEKVDEDVFRFKIYNGWLVKVYEQSLVRTPPDGYLDDQLFASMVYIPDPKHEWKIEDENNKENS